MTFFVYCDGWEVERAVLIYLPATTVSPRSRSLFDLLGKMESRLKQYLDLHEKDVIEVILFENFTQFHVRVRTNLNRNEENIGFDTQCSRWIKKVSESTKTQWIVRNSWPNLKLMLYRKLFVCHHSDFNKTATADRIRSKTRVKGRGCSASIDIKIKKVNRFTIRNDRYLKDGLCAIITVGYYLLFIN